jgi:6-phosphogluconolactonase (cycloisomerase 2 family)
MNKKHFYFTQTLLLSVVCLFFASTARAGFLYVLNQQNAAPNQIYGYLVNETTGALTPLFGFPVTTSGNGVTGTASEYLVIDRTNKRLYVINRGSNNIGAYSINTAIGALTPLPYSPITGIANETSIAVHPNGSPLIVAAGSIASSTAASFTVTGTTVTPAPGNNYSTGSRPFSSVFSRDGNYYYEGGGLSMTFSGFGVNAGNGALTTLAGSPYNTGATNPLAMATDTLGRLFVTTGVSNAVVLRAFTTASGVPTQVFTSNSSGLIGAADGALSPDEQFYLVADNGANQIGSYKINGTGVSTTLAPVAGSPFPANASTTNALVFNQAGTFVFAANSASRSVTTFSFDPATGAMNNINVQPNDTLGSTGFLAGMDYLPAIAPTAANISVSGRVFDSSAAGLSKASVTLIDSNGQTRTTFTNPFGYYKFDDIGVGQTVTINVSSKGYQFTPQVVNVTEDVADLNFSSQ